VKTFYVPFNTQIFTSCNKNCCYQNCLNMNHHLMNNSGLLLSHQFDIAQSLHPQYKHRRWSNWNSTLIYLRGAIWSLDGTISPST